MRLTEFADPRAYTLPKDDAPDFARSLRRILPDRTADDLASTARGNRHQPVIKSRKLSDAL
jgi:hypothetical protein